MCPYQVEMRPAHPHNEGPAASQGIVSWLPIDCGGAGKEHTRTLANPLSLALLRRVGALEEKIDGIVSLLTAAGARGDITQTPSPVDKGLGSASGSHMATGREEQKEAGPSPAQVILGEQTTTTPDALSLSFQHQDMLLEHFELVPGVRISFGEADRALDEYRTWFSPSFPFVPLPAQASAYDMYMEQPFLFRTIVQVALPQDAQAQQFARRWFRESIAQSVVVRQETRLELLQAMLIFLAWYVAPRFPTSPWRLPCLSS